MSIGEWKKEQEKDSAFCKVMQLIKYELLFKYRGTQNDDPELQNYLKMRKNLCVVKTLLHRREQLKNHLVEPIRVTSSLSETCGISMS